MQSLLDDLEIKIKELIDFFISLGYYSNIYEFVSEEKLSEDIQNLYNCLKKLEELKRDFSEFSDCLVKD